MTTKHFVVLTNENDHYKYRYKLVKGAFEFVCIRTVKKHVQDNDKVIFEGSPDKCRDFLESYSP